MAERPKGLEDASADPTVEELRREQRREARHTNYVHTEGQTHGLLFGAIAFGVGGLVLGGLFGLLAFDSGSPARIVMPIIIAVFAAWVGVVYFGGRTPEVEHETMSADGRPQDGSALRNRDANDASG
jgi:hypothetical protein